MLKNHVGSCCPLVLGCLAPERFGICESSFCLELRKPLKVNPHRCEIHAGLGVPHQDPFFNTFSPVAGRVPWSV